MNNILLELLVIIIIFALIMSVLNIPIKLYNTVIESIIIKRLNHDIRYVKLKNILTRNKFIIQFTNDGYLLKKDIYKDPGVKVKMSPYLKYNSDKSYVKKISFSNNGNSSYSGKLYIHGENSDYILTIRAADRYYYFKKEKK